MWTGRLARWSVILTVAAGIVSVTTGLLALMWFPELPDARPDGCMDPPCWDLDVGDASLLVLLPFIAHLMLLALALLMGGLSLLLTLAGSLRSRGLRALRLAAIPVAGALLVLLGGELLPHVANPCVLAELAGWDPPGFCTVTPQGADVPDNWHALDHAFVGFLPLSLVVAWWWRRTSRDPMKAVQR